MPNGTLRDHLDGKVANLEGLEHIPISVVDLMLKFFAACRRFARKSPGF